MREETFWEEFVSSPLKKKIVIIGVPLILIIGLFLGLSPTKGLFFIGIPAIILVIWGLKPEKDI